eukprot:gene16028-biopygen17224
MRGHQGVGLGTMGMGMYCINTFTGHVEAAAAAAAAAAVGKILASRDADKQLPFLFVNSAFGPEGCGVPVPM